MTDHTTEPYEGGAELAIARPVSRTVDLRDQVTDSWTDVYLEHAELARFLAPAQGLVPEPLRTPAKIMAATMLGREVGITPMAALNSIYIVEGKAGFSAEMMRALVLQAGHDLVVKHSDRTRCEIWGRRKGGEEWTKVSWTIQEAQQTQVFLSKDKGWGPLAAKAQWKSWPTEMLLARATTRLVRMIFADVIHGMRSVEELRDMTEIVDAEIVEEGPPVVEPVQRRRAPRPAPRTQPAEQPATQPEADATPEVPEESKPVQRQRMARPAPRSAPASIPVENHAVEAAAVVDVLPDEPVPDADGVVDAEVVVEPATPSGTTGAEDPRRKITTYTLMQWDRLHVTDRAERLYLTAELVGHPVTSTNDLTIEELRGLADTLGRSRDLKALQAVIDQRLIDAEADRG
jgi:hypothetical protein